MDLERVTRKDAVAVLWESEAEAVASPNSMSPKATSRSRETPQKKRTEYVTLTPRPISGARSLMNDVWFR